MSCVNAGQQLYSNYEAAVDKDDVQYLCNQCAASVHGEWRRMLGNSNEDGIINEASMDR